MTSLSWKLVGLVSGLMLIPAAWAQSGAPAPIVTVGGPAPAVNTDVPPSPAVSTDLPPAPTVRTDLPPAMSAVPPPVPAVRTGSTGEGAGTTIIGDQESPIGLYLTPWKNEYAERGMDRPARIVQETLAPIDQKVFHRQIEYYDKITDYRKTELAGSRK